ncbi:MAG TPA: peptidoglycan recognition family protein, partial [Vicinamibacteria bacterium]|nr:peptidoglycan recognition family protein [Vicinamibacteria bacterium]
RDSSHGLLRYVQRLHLYNYLIDRFGRTFRVVEEKSKANHAGHSIWENDGRVYLSLNNAFLGICFESRWEGGAALPITEAQLSAGRGLTEYLRQRWSIPPEMCVSHGLASVNAKRHLIGEHLDWARGFPFEAFGLPDQYRRPAPSVAEFGFNYDDGFLKVLGEPWPGVRDAERSLAAEASRQGKTVDELRRERQGLYDRWLSEQARDEEAFASSRADRAPLRGPQGG